MKKAEELRRAYLLELRALEHWCTSHADQYGDEHDFDSAAAFTECRREVRRLIEKQDPAKIDVRK